MSTPLLRVNNLAVSFPGRRRSEPPVPVLHDVSLEILPGETLGLVGESGSGKTTLGRAVLGLVPIAAGDIEFEGKTISGLPRRERRQLAHSISVVFQDPYSSLNPAMTVEDILTEPLSQSPDNSSARDIVRDLLRRVHLPSDAQSRLPGEFSGGQRQRIAIARALAVNPQLIVCDEPTSALDLSTQATILELLVEIQESAGVAYLFITHDLAAVRAMSHRIAVMRGGKIVETGPALRVSDEPSHPYTRRLQLSAPTPDPREQARRRELRSTLVPVSDATS